MVDITSCGPLHPSKANLKPNHADKWDQAFVYSIVYFEYRLQHNVIIEQMHTLVFRRFRQKSHYVSSDSRANIASRESRISNVSSESSLSGGVASISSDAYSYLI